MTYSRMSFISGVIIFVAGLIFFGSILWLSGQRILSANEYKLYVKFADVVGLKDKSQVFMRGYRVGWTKDVRFVEDGVIVRVDIKREFQVPVDSKVEINTLNFMGEKAITITPGVAKEYFAKNTVIAGENRDLMIEAKNILATIKGKLDEGNLERIVKDVSETVSESRDAAATVNQKVGRLDAESWNRQVLEIGQAARSIRELASAGDTSLQNIDRSLARADSLSSELTLLTRRLNRGEGSVGALLRDETYARSVDSTVVELRKLIADIRANPKRYIQVSVF